MNQTHWANLRCVCGRKHRLQLGETKDCPCGVTGLTFVDSVDAEGFALSTPPATAPEGYSIPEVQGRGIRRKMITITDYEYETDEEIVTVCHAPRGRGK